MQRLQYGQRRIPCTKTSIRQRTLCVIYILFFIFNFIPCKWSMLLFFHLLHFPPFVTITSSILLAFFISHPITFISYYFFFISSLNFQLTYLFDCFISFSFNRNARTISQSIFSRFFFLLFMYNIKYIKLWYDYKQIFRMESDGV